MYQQEITTGHRTAIVIAVDRSKSMSDRICVKVGQTRSKAEEVALAVNRLIRELMIRATRDGVVRDYYDLAVLGYSERGAVPLIDERRVFIPVSELVNYAPRRSSVIVERCTCSGESVVSEESVQMWVEPVARGCTPMYEALWDIRSHLRDWCSRPCNGSSFPPVVINITDGQASDCRRSDLRAIADDIRSLHTSDGNVLLMNICVSGDGNCPTLLFPTADEVAASGDGYACLLAECSSVMPEPFNALIAASRCDGVQPPYLAMGCNTQVGGLVEMLNIGSRSVTGIR